MLTRSHVCPSQRDMCFKVGQHHKQRTHVSVSAAPSVSESVGGIYRAAAYITATVIGTETAAWALSMRLCYLLYHLNTYLPKH